MHASIYLDWTKSLLIQNGLLNPDGRPLYAYRVSDDSFTRLIEILKNRSNAPISLVMKQRGFDHCWLVYAAEWWKRCYEGGSWSWAPIFKSIGFDDQNHEVCRELVASASNYWKLSDEAIGGKKYIGKVVVNGGLPLRLIKEAGGSLSRLLKAVLTEASSSSTPLNDVQLLAQVELQRTHLPKSYRQISVYQLLAQMVGAILELKSNCTGAGELDPIAHLDKNHPNWLQRFPLNVDQDAAKQLLGGLIRYAVTTYQRPRQPFTIVRQVRFNHDQSEWQYECLFDASTRYPINAIAEMLGTTDELPASMDLVLHSESSTRTVGQLLRRNDDYIINININQEHLPHEWFYQSLRLEVSRLGRVLGALEIQGSEGPDPLVPWVFEDTSPVCRLIWAGSFKLADQSCLIITPKSATLFSMEDHEKLISHSKENKLHRLTNGEVHIGIQKESFQIKCSAPQTDISLGVVWGTNRLFVESTPSHIFTGLPTLFRVTDHGERQPVPKSELFWRCNDSDLPFDKVTSYGLGTLFWRKEGKTLQRLKAVCLPNFTEKNSQSHIEFIYCNEIKPTGIIKLNHWPIAGAFCNTENILLQSECDGSNWQLRLTSQESPPPLKVKLTLKWLDGQSQVIWLPFPIEGAFIVDDADVCQKKSARVSLQEIRKLRVQLRGVNQRKWQIRMRLEGCDEARNLLSQNINIHNSPGYANQEVRLFDLQNQIRQMLSLTNALDAHVRIDFLSGEKIQNSLIISRYSHSIHRDLHKGWVTLNNDREEILNPELLANSSLQTVSLLDVENQCRDLPSVLSEHVHVGSWDFQPERKMPGTWLLFPSIHSAALVRPIIWNIPNRFAIPSISLTGLKAALDIVDREERINKLVLTFEAMAGNPNSSDWKYVQSFVDTLGHLPLASLDLWVAMVRVPRAVVLAFLSLENFIEQVAERLSQELPFEWLLTSPQDWLVVINELRKHANKTGGEREERLLKRELEWRLEWIRNRYPALQLSVSLGLIKGLGIDLKDPEIRFLLSLPNKVVDLWLPKLLLDDESDAQNFMRRVGFTDTHDMQAPTQLKAETKKFSLSESGLNILNGFRLTPDDWKHSLIVAPLMIAYSVAKGNAEDWLGQTKLLLALRQYREFDQQWFDEAYKVAMACAFNERLISV